MSNSEETDDYEQLFSARNELHKVMRRVIVLTKLGSREREPDDDLYLEIAGGELDSCLRHEFVRFFPDEELPTVSLFGYEFDDDIKGITYFIKEIKQRFLQFQKARDANKPGYVKGKKKFAERYFSKPFDSKILKRGK